MSRQIVVAYWLIPAEPERSFFQGSINELAQRYDAPIFEPHLTIFVGANRYDSAERALSSTGRDCEAITLNALEIDHSSQFVKTLFVQFAPSTELDRLNEAIRSAAQDSSQYQLNPHLSLLYKTSPAKVRRKLANSIKLPFSKVTFNTFKAVRCVSPTQTPADVERQEVLVTRKMCG